MVANQSTLLKILFICRSKLNFSQNDDQCPALIKLRFRKISIKLVKTFFAKKKKNELIIKLSVDHR